MKTLILISALLALLACSSVSREITHEVKIDKIEKADISLKHTNQIVRDLI